MVDVKVYTTSYKFYSFELSAVICQNPSGYAEPVHHALQELDRRFLVIFATSMASIHLANVSIMTIKNLNPPGALGSMPMMSIP
jgi:hypothetical protein